MKRIGAAFFVAAASSYAAMKAGGSTPSFTAPNSKVSPFAQPNPQAPVITRNENIVPSSATPSSSQRRDDGKDDGSMQGFNFFTRSSGCDCKVPGGMGCMHRIVSLHEIDQLVSQQVCCIILPASAPQHALHFEP
jgi:hypothetical protein